MKKNSRGFTLVELIAVLAIMIIILLIAIPSITSSVDRNKNNLSEQAINIITTSAEVYSSMYMALIEKQVYDEGNCYIEVSSLIEKELLKESELKELTTISNINEYRIFNLKELGIRIFAPDGTLADGTTPKKIKMPTREKCRRAGVVDE